MLELRKNVGAMRIAVRLFLSEAPEDRQIGKLMRWRRGPELNRRIRVLQTPALPLGYHALLLMGDRAQPSHRKRCSHHSRCGQKRNNHEAICRDRGGHINPSLRPPLRMSFLGSFMARLRSSLDGHPKHRPALCRSSKYQYVH